MYVYICVSLQRDPKALTTSKEDTHTQREREGEGERERGNGKEECEIRIRDVMDVVSENTKLTHI
jgi:hypothetical protein